MTFCATATTFLVLVMIWAHKIIGWGKGIHFGDWIVSFCAGTIAHILSNVNVGEVGHIILKINVRTLTALRLWWNILLLRWRYSPRWALASVTIRLQASRSHALSLHLFIPIFLSSVDTSSSHLIFGLPLRLVAYSFPYVFFGIAVCCILSIWPSHRILLHFINLTMFSPLIIASNSSFRPILHYSFSFTAPYISRSFSFQIQLMLFPLPRWVSTILNHR